VRNVGNPLARALTSLNTGEFMLEKDLMSAVNVGASDSLGSPGHAAAPSPHTGHV